jgi:hypothetical protein
MARQHAERIMAVEPFVGDGREREKTMRKENVWRRTA